MGVIVTIPSLGTSQEAHANETTFRTYRQGYITGEKLPLDARLRKTKRSVIPLEDRIWDSRQVLGEPRFGTAWN